MNKTNTIIIATLIIGLLIGAALYYYTMSISSRSDDNSSKIETNKITNSPEKQYNNEKYGFSFSYDSTKYTITESKSRGGATGDQSDLIRMKEIGESCPAVDIFISTATLEEELKDIELGIDGDSVQTTVDGIPATKKSGEITENITSCGSEETKIVFKQNGNVFLITSFKNWENSLEELLESISF